MVAQGLAPRVLPCSSPAGSVLQPSLTDGRQVGRWGWPWGLTTPPATLGQAHAQPLSRCHPWVAALVSGRGRWVEGVAGKTLTSARWRHLVCAVCGGLVSKLAKGEATAQMGQPRPASWSFRGSVWPQPERLLLWPLPRFRTMGQSSLPLVSPPLPILDVSSSPTCGHGTLQLAGLGGDPRAQWGNRLRAGGRLC